MRGDNAHCLRRIRATVSELAQIVRETQHWHRLHPNDPPLDVEADRVMLNIARQAEAAIAVGDRELFSEKMGQLVQYGAASLE